MLQFEASPRRCRGMSRSMPRWSPCQAPPPPLFTSFVAMLHLGNDFVKTLAGPGEAVSLCGRISTQGGPPSAIFLQNDTPQTFSDRLRRRAVLGLRSRCGSGFLSHSPILHARTSQTQSSPRRTFILHVWQCAVTQNSTKGSKLV